MQNKNYPQTKTLIQRGVGKPTRTKLTELRELLGDLDVLTNRRFGRTGVIRIKHFSHCVTMKPFTHQARLGAGSDLENVTLTQQQRKKVKAKP